MERYGQQIIERDVQFYCRGKFYYSFTLVFGFMLY